MNSFFTLRFIFISEADVKYDLAASLHGFARGGKGSAAQPFCHGIAVLLLVIIAIFAVLAMAFIASIAYYFVSIRMVPVDEFEYRIMQQAISEGVEFTDEYLQRYIVAYGLNNEVNPYTSPLDKVWELELVTQE